MLLEYEEQSLFRMSLFYIIILRIPIYINFIFTAEVLFQEMFSIYYFLQTPAHETNKKNQQCTGRTTSDQ
jgi:hypothetical protein